MSLFHPDRAWSGHVARAWRRVEVHPAPFQRPGTVKVTMPSGRVYSVSEITVSNGYITDNIGRDIPSLVITR